MVRVAETDLTVVSWDTSFDEHASSRALVALSQGKFHVPKESPIAPGAELSGTPFAPTLLSEASGRLNVEGTGTLITHGFAIEGAVQGLIAHFRKVWKRDDVGAELAASLRSLSREAGLGDVFVETRRIGIVECLSRALPQSGRARVCARLEQQPTPETPRSRIVVSRLAAAGPEDLRVFIQARSGKAVVMERLIDLASTVPKMIIDAGVHVTSLSVHAFDEFGLVADREHVSFANALDVNVTFQGAIDTLPLPFSGSPDAPDLQARARVITDTTSISSAADLAGGLDVMRRNAVAYDIAAGAEHAELESHFFPSGPDGQLEVIRWIKRQLEQPSVTRAFLVDPFLGSDALRRVVLRQGNERVTLTILVSPGGIDPDADALASPAADPHVQRLIVAAEQAAPQLCGAIEIMHIRRGESDRQAFHDRYMGLVERDGRIRVFLLSNSLNKAAGDWPFAVSELDTPAAWRVKAYVENLIKGKDGRRKLLVDTVWRSVNSATKSAPPEGQPMPAPAAERMEIYLALHQLDIAERREAIGPIAGIEKLIDRLTKALPPPDQPSEIASAVVDMMNGRDHLAMLCADFLRKRPAYLEAAELLNSILIDLLLDRLAPPDGRPHFGQEPEWMLRLAGQAISRIPGGTDMVRNRINPAVDKYARLLAAGRVEEGSYELLLAGLSLVQACLHLVLARSEIPPRHRFGIAQDHISLLGRILGSSGARGLLTSECDDWTVGLDEARTALQLAEQIAADSHSPVNVRASFEILRGDPAIPAVLARTG